MTKILVGRKQVPLWEKRAAPKPLKAGDIVSGKSMDYKIIKIGFDGIDGKVLCQPWSIGINKPHLVRSRKVWLWVKNVKLIKAAA